MTVFLVISTLMIFILIDYLSSRGTVAAAATSPQPAELPPVEPVWVAGYQVPEPLHYHRGHTWARPLDADTAVVGIDDFARRLLGGASKVKAPAVGTWVRQGAPAIGVAVGGRAAELVSPVEGEVVEVNEALHDHPSLPTDDPYGRGWLYKVRTSDLRSSLRNLFSGSLARRFTEDAREALDLRLMALSGSVLQDGGEPVADFALHLPPQDWRRLVGDFLLT
jgi:glycine cleavage system H protein